jgi:hypothetical protein
MWVDVGSGEKSEHDGPEACDVIDPVRERQPHGVARDSPNDDFE